MSEPPRSRLIAGAMSGTSGDGVDVAITRVRISERRAEGLSAELVRHHHVPFDPALQKLLFRVRRGGTSALADLARLGREISLTYARAVIEALGLAGLPAKDLDAIAAHGQTLYHAPPDTIQWFDPALVAAETGCAVVSDFRRADCAAGGQGAPLVPFADYVLFRHAMINRVLVNIGGIANLTYLKAGGSLSDVIAFDTGPGNCISDWLARRHLGRNVDEEGIEAVLGKASEPVVAGFLGSAFVGQPPPKSTDGPAMIAAFESALSAAGGALSIRDQFATAAAITAATIAKGIADVVGAERLFGEVIASGGGTKNAAIIVKLAGLLARNPEPTAALGVPGDAKEALAFALLGAATLEGIPSNVPSVTGARRAVVLGSITPKPY